MFFQNKFNTIESKWTAKGELAVDNLATKGLALVTVATAYALYKNSTSARPWPSVIIGGIGGGLALMLAKAG